MISQEHETSDWKYYIWPNYFSPEQCKAIIDACESPLWIQGEVNEGKLDKKLRNVKQQGLMMNGIKKNRVDRL